MFIANWLILLIGLLFNASVFCWNENLRNGFRTGAPFNFIKYPGHHALLDIIIFFILLLFLQISWYIIIIFYIFSMFVGLAFSEKGYKKFLNEIIDKEEKEKGKSFTEDERKEKLKVFYEAQKITQKIRDEKRIK